MDQGQQCKQAAQTWQGIVMFVECGVQTRFFCLYMFKEGVKKWDRLSRRRVDEDMRNVLFMKTKVLYRKTDSFKPY